MRRRRFSMHARMHLFVYIHQRGKQIQPLVVGKNALHRFPTFERCPRIYQRRGATSIHIYFLSWKFFFSLPSSSLLLLSPSKRREKKLLLPLNIFIVMGWASRYTDQVVASYLSFYTSKTGARQIKREIDEESQVAKKQSLTEKCLKERAREEEEEE